MGRTGAVRWRTAGIAAIAFFGGILASQCSQRVSARTRAVVDIRPINRTIDLAKYNCAGFAFRNYRYMNLDEVREVLSQCPALPQADAPCPPGWVKIWAWEYDVHRETEDGQVSTPRRDGHLVAGLTSRTDGRGPHLVYCKYAGGPIEGPAAPESWAPPAREEVGTNSMGRKVFIVRQRVTLRWYCVSADALQRFAGGATNDGR